MPPGLTRGRSRMMSARRGRPWARAIAARGPVDIGAGVHKAMWELRGDDKSVFSTFAYTFTFRPMLKIICFSAALVVLAVLVNFGLLGIGAITGRTRSKQSPDEREK